MSDKVTYCSYETVEDREKCLYYEKVSYRGSKQCTYCRVNGTCFIGGVEGKFKQKGTESKASKWPTK